MSVLRRHLPALLGFVAALAVATSAAAQVRVRVQLDVPAGHPGIVIEAVRLLEAGALVRELSTFVSATGETTVSATLPVDAAPDALEVDFRTPLDGIDTTLSVPPAQFLFDVPFFFPLPSPGGVVAPGPGDPALDASITVSLLDRGDGRGPSCEILEPASPGDPRLLEIQDDSGLEDIVVRRARNISITVPAFTPGTTDPVRLPFHVVDPDRTAFFVVRPVDSFGNRSLCKHIERRLRRPR